MSAWVCKHCGKPANVYEFGSTDVEAWRDAKVKGVGPDGKLVVEVESRVQMEPAYGYSFSAEGVRCAECEAEEATFDDLVVPAGMDATSKCARCGHGRDAHPELGWNRKDKSLTRGPMPCTGCDCHDFHEPVVADWLVAA